MRHEIYIHGTTNKNAVTKEYGHIQGRYNCSKEF